MDTAFLTEVLLWAAGAFLFFFGSTYLLKKFGKAQTYYFVSLIKTRRFLPLLDGFKKHKRILNAIADAGLIFGFGAVAVDYLWGRGKSKPFRLALFAVSAFLLYFLLELLSRMFFVFQVLFSNPFISWSDIWVKIAFSIMGLSGALIVTLAAYGEFILDSILSGKKVCPGVGLIIPGVQIPKIAPIAVPLHGWISFVIMMLLHEGMHGALARKAKIRIKSAGLVLVGLLPFGAFVEPDEKQLKRAKPLEQARVYSAGPSSNLFASMAIPLVITIFMLAVFTPFFSAWFKEVRLNSVAGVFVTSVDQNIDIGCGEVYSNPAFGSIAPGMLLLKINDRNITTADDVSLALYGNKKPFTVEAIDANGTAVKKTIVPNELGIANFAIEEKPNPNYTPPASFEILTAASNFAVDFLFWLILLNFLIAIVNFLPTEPFDGGKMAKILLLPYFGFLHMNKKETEKFIGRLMLWIVGAIILANALPLVL